MVSPSEPRGLLRSLLIRVYIAVFGIATGIAAIPTEKYSMLMRQYDSVLHLDAPKIPVICQ